MFRIIANYFREREKRHIDKQYLKMRQMFPCTWCGSLKHETYVEQVECCKKHYNNIIDNRVLSNH